MPAQVELSRSELRIDERLNSPSVPDSGIAAQQDREEPLTEEAREGELKAN